jgi:hypothetical protein
MTETGESVRERQGEQEAEQDLNAQSGYPQLLKQFREVAIISLCLRFVSRIW